MRITDLNRGRPGARPHRAQTSSSARAAFADTLAQAGVRGSQGAPEVAVLSGVFGVQEVTSATDRGTRRRAAQRAEAILDELHGLQQEILAGTVSQDRLATLTATLRARREDGAMEPHLEELLMQIELRAEVELAKLEARH